MAFFRGGGKSVPTLLCQRWTCRNKLAQTLRMQLLVAELTNTDQLTLTTSPNAEGKVWTVPQMKHMVDNTGRPKPAFCLAELALVAVQIKHVITQRLPLWPGVKQIFTTVLD